MGKRGIGVAMKQALIAAVALATFVGTPALAADMALKAPPPSAPVATWTGWYIGADVGGTWFNQSATWNPLPSAVGFNAFPITGTERGSGLIGGVYAGYNYQISPKGLVGIEADISGTRANGNVTQVITAFATGIPVPGSFTSMSSRLDWLSSVRGRIGVLATPSVLAYVTGGAAWGGFNYSASNSNGGVGAAFYNAPVSFNKTQSGFVVGGGLEWMATRNWLLRAEYLYYDFNSGPNVIGTSVNFPTFPSNYVWGKANVNVARVGAAYKF
jgi:outer membrane immunogenic protein